MKNARSESGTILVVNDKEAICNVVRQMLERADYRVLEAHDAEEALEICRQSWERSLGPFRDRRANPDIIVVLTQ